MVCCERGVAILKRKKRSSFKPTFILLLAALLAAACTRSSVPPDSVTTAVAERTQTYQTQIAATPGQVLGGLKYAVAWIAKDEFLVVRRPAGVSGSVVAELAYDDGGVEKTGNTSMLGSSTWVEILVPSSGTGWVNDANLTEEIAGESFCSDARIMAILDTLGKAITDMDGHVLAPVVNPRRGLIIRHNWWNPEVIFSPEAVNDLYSDLTEFEWGVLSGSSFPIQGSFQEVIAPQLRDTFENEPQIGCNELLIGRSTRDMIWLGEYENLNFYAFYRPAPAGGNDFDWRTWVAGIEYLQGQPFLTLLIQFRGDI